MKKIISVLMFTLVILLTACGETKTQSFSFDKSNPIPITISVSDDFTKINISNGNVNSTINKDDLTDYLENNTLTLDASFFKDLENGTYKLEVIASKQITLTVVVSGESHNFEVIDGENTFSQSLEKYYVIFSDFASKDGIKLSNDTEKFDIFLNSFPEGCVSKLFVVKYSNKEANKIESLVGINNYEDLIKENSLVSPTLVVIENGVITSYYTGYTDISSFLNIEQRKISQKNILHNIDNPKVIKIETNFVPKKYSVTDSSNKAKTFTIPEEYKEDSVGYYAGEMIFPMYRFNNWEAGNYKLKIFNDDESIEVNLFIRSTFNYIYAEDLFNQKEERYYVFFLRDGCSGCNYVKPTLLSYSQNYSSYNSDLNYPLYAIHRSQNPSSTIYVNPNNNSENFVGVDDIKDLRLGYFPRVVLVENGVITAVYKNEGNAIMDHFSNIMK